MSKPTDVRLHGATLFFLPVQTRVPLKFGTETLTSVTCARVRMSVMDRRGRSAEGWGETPLSVQWVWPSTLTYEERHDGLKAFCEVLTTAWGRFEAEGHPIEIGHRFLESELPRLLDGFNAQRADREPMPWLAALVCCSAFDIALHDAYGMAHECPIYDTYNADFMNADLSAYLSPASRPGGEPGTVRSFSGRYPADYLTSRADVLPAWHLVGGMDALGIEAELPANPGDGHPITLVDWIQRDGLKCLKVKLRGNDPAWDTDRIEQVGRIAFEQNCHWLSADFNCTVHDPDYVNAILDGLMHTQPRIYGMILYVEQPFPYDLETNRIDVHSVSARKPLFMDESAHDWRLVRLGRELGWTGVALKTCKTQTGALLTLCWARAHGMTLMVQDLTNPMLAQIPHLLLAAYGGTIMGVETNGMQFYPEASDPEAVVHPGIYRRRDGKVDLTTISGPGFGYQLDAIDRTLPEPTASAGRG